MTKDLEETLAELGPGYDGLVNALKQARAVGRRESARRIAAKRLLMRRVAYLVAASLAIALAFVSLVVAPLPRAGVQHASRHAVPAIYTAAYAGEDSAEALVRSQSPDGSWNGSDFVTRQNAAALRGVASASVAYRKALRYLRSRGLAPLSDDELRSRASMLQQLSDRPAKRDNRIFGIILPSFNT